jgi:hypothetical protein
MRTTARTRLAACAGVAALAVTLSACGGSDSSDPEATSGEASSSAAEAGSDSGSDGGSASGSTAAAPEGGYDAEALLAAMKAAVEDTESAHLVMDIASQGQQMAGEGDFSYEGDQTEMQMTMDVPDMGSTLEMRLVDEIMYVAMPPLSPKGKFLKIDVNDPNSPMGDLSSVTQGDPRQTFDAFEAGLQKARYVGEEQVDGETLDHYVLTVDAAKAAEAQGMGGQGAAAGPKTLTYDLWIDDQNLMRKITMDSGGVDLTMEMSQWGEPVTVEAPPASAIMQMPQMQGGGVPN